MDPKRRRGVTLVEMLVVVAIIAVMAGVAFPTVSAGLDSIRLTAATDSVVSFMNAALNQAQRRQQVVAVAISKTDNSLELRSTEPGFHKSLKLPDGISIRNVFPELPQEQEGPRRFLLYPGGTMPRFGVEIAGRRGLSRAVRIDPITGVPKVERLEQK